MSVKRNRNSEAMTSGERKNTSLSAHVNTIGQEEATRKLRESEGCSPREANYRMEEFLGVASHELRTPLTTIKANIQLAIRRLKAVIQLSETVSAEVVAKVDAAQDMLLRAERQVGVLNRLVGDLVDISRIQTDKLQLYLHQEPTDLTFIVREAVQEQCKAAPERIILLEAPTDTLAPVLVDSNRIAQVLTNYLNNALKYSEPDKPIQVTLTVEDDVARVSVRDEGPGLAPQEQERIWECFYQAERIKVLNGSNVGLGLGLHISQTIIAQHQGQVGVQSASGDGSMFWFTLPLVKNAPKRTIE